MICKGAADMSVYRIYVEKKPEFAVEADSLLGGIKSALGLENLKGLRVINRYDAELKKTKGASAVKISEKANAETAKMVEEETSKVLSSVLKEACNVMKNSYARSDA